MNKQEATKIVDTTSTLPKVGQIVRTTYTCPEIGTVRVTTFKVARVYQFWPGSHWVLGDARGREVPLNADTTWEVFRRVEGRTGRD